MSDNYLRFIPTDPEYVPEARDAARNLLAALLPDAQKVKASLHDEVQFVDCGTNFEKILCPRCRARIDMDWWSDSMRNALHVKFRQLEVTLPCCHEPASLNDLDYRWPMGMARFVLEAMNPNVRELSPEGLEQLEQLLGCRLRAIWAHY
jgi:hypothetical protein